MAELAAFAASGLVGPDENLMFYGREAAESDASSDYGNLLLEEGVDQELLSTDGGDTSDVSRVLRHSPRMSATQSIAQFLPSAESQLARQISEHTEVMVTQHYERQLDELTSLAQHRERALRQREKDLRREHAAALSSLRRDLSSLKHEVKRRDKALKTLAHERDALVARAAEADAVAKDTTAAAEAELKVAEKEAEAEIKAVKAEAEAELKTVIAQAEVAAKAAAAQADAAARAAEAQADAAAKVAAENAATAARAAAATQTRLSDELRAATRRGDELAEQLAAARKHLATLQEEHERRLRDSEREHERQCTEFERQLVTAEAKREKQLSALEQKREKQMSAAEQKLVAAKAQAASERQAFDVRIAAQQERLEEVSTRCLRSEQVEQELRRELESQALKLQDVERSLADTRAKLESSRNELSSAAAAASLERERVALLHREVEKLDESARRAHAGYGQREAEVRELSAALAAAREQRNQASRDAELCRVNAAEASDDLQRSAELVAASESRVAHAERRAVQEAMGRQRAETQVQEMAVAERSSRAARQRRMLGVLIRASRMQATFGFTRWIAACVAIDAEAARAQLKAEASVASGREESCRALLAALELRNAQGDRASALGEAWLACASWALMRRDASVMLARWSTFAFREALIIRRWERLLKAIEMAPRKMLRRPRPSADPQAGHAAADSALPTHQGLHAVTAGVVLAGGGEATPSCVSGEGSAHPGYGFRRLQPTARMLLRVRTDRLRSFYKRNYFRHRATYIDANRYRRCIFVLWRQWVRGELLAEAHIVQQAREAGLHVASAKRLWWEAQAE